MELGSNPVSTRFSLSMEMSRLTRDGTAEPVSRDQNSQAQKTIFLVQLTTRRIGSLTRSILTLAICDDHSAKAESSSIVDEPGEG